MESVGWEEAEEVRRRERARKSPAKIRALSPVYTPSFEEYMLHILPSPDYKPINLTYRSSCSLGNLEDLEMESVGSGEHSEVEPVQDVVGLPAAAGVVESFNVCPENPTRDDFGTGLSEILEKG